MMPNDCCFALKRRCSLARSLPNCNQSASTILNSTYAGVPAPATRLRNVTQESIHREAEGRAEGASVCARDRKMVGAAAVASEVRRAFAGQAGLLPGAWCAPDTLAGKTPLPVHRRR